MREKQSQILATMSRELQRDLTPTEAVLQRAGDSRVRTSGREAHRSKVLDTLVDQFENVAASRWLVFLLSPAIELRTGANH
jgi:Tfp pilus assembly protein FimV